MSTQAAAHIITRNQRSEAHRIERFRFDQSGQPAPSGHTHEHSAGDARHRHSAAAPVSEAENETRKQIEQAREDGYQQGLQQAQQKFDDDLRRERLGISRAIEEFAQDRFRYFRRVEREVVELSLSIARRILHRESQMDPLMLQGAVRAVLDRVADATSASMRVHPSRLAAWEEWFERNSRQQRPRLATDATLAVDQCVLETSMGSTDIGVDAQLEEIEHGFCDLLATRSPVANNPASHPPSHPEER